MGKICSACFEWFFSRVPTNQRSASAFSSVDAETVMMFDRFEASSPCVESPPFPQTTLSIRTQAFTLAESVCLQRLTEQQGWFLSYYLTSFYFFFPLVFFMVPPAFGAIFQGSLFGLAGVLPASYTTPIMSGQGLAGTFAALSMICALASMYHTHIHTYKALYNSFITSPQRIMFGVSRTVCDDC